MFCPSYEVAIIYLHIAMSCDPFFSFSLGSPTKFGFLAYGVYPFHLTVSKLATSLWHIIVSTHILTMKGYDGRQDCSCLDLLIDLA